MSERERGKVKRFGKGYGFIKPHGGGEDVFVHYSQIQPGKEGYKELDEGQEVEYELIPSEKKPGKFAAANVEVV